MPRKVLLFNLDGCRADALERAKGIPNIRRLQREGLCAPRARTIFPSTTGPGHATILSGAFPERTGLTGHFTWDRARRRLFDLQAGPFLGAETVFEALERAGRESLCVGPRVAWKGSGTTGGLRRLLRRVADAATANQTLMRSRLLFPLLHALRFNYRILDFLRGDLSGVERSLREGRHDFYYVVFPQTDKAGHVHGPFSEECLQALERCDEAIGRLLAAAPALERDFLVGLTADHGMSPIERKANVSLFSLDGYGFGAPEVFRHPIGRELRIVHYRRGRPDEAVGVFCTRHVQFWFGDPAQAPRGRAAIAGRPEIREAFGAERYGELRMAHPRAPDFTAVLADGWGFDANAWKGDHGGTNDDDMHVPLVLWGDGVPHREIPSADTADILPTLLPLAGLPVPKDAQGRSLL